MGDLLPISRKESKDAFAQKANENHSGNRINPNRIKDDCINNFGLYYKLLYICWIISKKK